MQVFENERKKKKRKLESILTQKLETVRGSCYLEGWGSTREDVLVPEPWSTKERRPCSRSNVRIRKRAECE